MVGILLSYWGGLFSGATLVSGRVFFWVKKFEEVKMGDETGKTMTKLPLLRLSAHLFRLKILFLGSLFNPGDSK